MADIIPFDDRDGLIWHNGAFIPWRDAKLHVLSHGLHYASCVFEGERAYDGKIFKSAAHTDRLFKSAEILDMALPYSKEELGKVKQELLDKQDLKNAYVRAFAWRGSEMMAVSAQQTKIHLAVAAWDWPSYFSLEQKKKGIKLDIAEWKRPSPESAPYQAKAAGLYMICTLSKHKAERQGYADALMPDYRGYISEATGANIFFVKDGALHTPKPDCFLNGITRQTVIELAEAKGIPVIERHMTFEELPDFEQCFLTGSAAEITPVSEIKGQKYQVGPLVLDLCEAYDQLVRS
ncbi:MAG: branched-chain amino acid aminotransferase [Pseudomonadota bacterium]